MNNTHNFKKLVRSSDTRRAGAGEVRGGKAGRRQRNVGRGAVQAGEDDGGQNRVGRAGGAGRVRTERTRDTTKKRM